ncbi:MAG: TetR/AcrR family transcriptional regulator, partial [Oligoflexus sp.]
NPPTPKQGITIRGFRNSPELGYRSTMTKQNEMNVLSADDRRERVAQATWAVISREGLDRASLRAIAQELGSTTGVLTHYFRDKEALLDFAFASIVEKLQFGAGSSATPADLASVSELLGAYLPLTADTRVWWRVWLSFTVAALAHKKRGENHAKLYKELSRFWTEVLSDLSQKGALRPNLDMALEAETLLALIDGIGIHALITPRSMTAKRQLQIVECHFAKLAAAAG